MAKIITVTSGKGGVGKTNISLNLSLALASAGHRVCLFDADLGMANVNILTGIFPEYGLEMVMGGDKELRDIMIRDFQGVDIIPGSSGVEQMADLTPAQARTLIQSFLELDAYDYFIFDTSAGISAQVLAFCRASQEILVVITPEPTSLTDAYSLIKVLVRHRDLPPVRVVVNQVKTPEAAKVAYGKLKRTVSRFLPVSISARGIVAYDSQVPMAVASQIPFLMLYPDGPASRSIQALARKFSREQDPSSDLPLEMFWDQCLGYMVQEKAPEPLADHRPSDAETGEKTPESGPDMAARLDDMDEKISLILEELSEIRKLMGQREEEGPASDVPEEKRVQALTLDFEEWLARRRSQG